MRNIYKACLMGSTILACLPLNAQAQATHDHHNHHDHHVHAGNSAPISVMGDHTHQKGDWMVSYRYQHMDMNGNRKGTSSISPEEIVTTLSNPNGPPATVRVVPTDMNMDMHMFGAMYGLTEKITLMAMAMYMDNDMTHITFAGMTGTTELGRFKTRSKGWGDTSLSGIYNLYKDQNHSVNLSLGISAPTGSIKEKDDVLTPMGTTPTLRLPYTMQLGSGTWDALPGVTYSGHKDKWSWGAQYKAVIRMESENSQGYRWGNRHSLTGWSGYKLSDQVSATALISAQTMGKIKGSDTNITAPVQTANPDNYGGESVDIGAGFTYTPDIPSIRGLEIGTELRVPVYQNLNGVQMDRDWNLTAGMTYRF